MEAHEKWSYDEDLALQKLEDVLALCTACHQVVHISRTQLMGKGDDAMEHFMKVNDCSQIEFHEELGKANEIYRRRNRVESWTCDVSWLKNKFDIHLK